MENNIVLDASLYSTTWVVVSNGENAVCEVGFTVVNDGILVEVTGRDEENTSPLILLNENSGNKIVIKVE